MLIDKILFFHFTLASSFPLSFPSPISYPLSQHCCEGHIYLARKARHFIHGNIVESFTFGDWSTKTGRHCWLQYLTTHQTYCTDLHSYITPLYLLGLSVTNTRKRINNPMLWYDKHVYVMFLLVNFWLQSAVGHIYAEARSLMYT